ncbi:MAG: outer membrane lipoprotein carrier protein LolA [Melioribacteraceae bacterium]|nr:outer membrane lipoprotein carrier protein LolA [Melioribacteraceae bacterium]
MKEKIFLLFFISGFVFAQNPKEFINKIQSKFNSISNFTAKFNQTFFTAHGTEGGKTSGNFYYKKKNKFLVEISNNTISSNGNTVWNYDKRFKRVVISNFSDDPTSFSLEKFIFAYPPLCKAEILKEEGDVLLLTPKDNDLQFKQVKIWKTSDNLISKMELVDIGDLKYSFSFSDIKINQDLQDSKFEFQIPQGTQIIDLR